MFRAMLFAGVRRMRPVRASIIACRALQKHRQKATSAYYFWLILRLNQIQKAPGLRPPGACLPGFVSL